MSILSFQLEVKKMYNNYYTLGQWIYISFYHLVEDKASVCHRTKYDPYCNDERIPSFMVYCLHEKYNLNEIAQLLHNLKQYYLTKKSENVLESKT